MRSVASYRETHAYRAKNCAGVNQRALWPHRRTRAHDQHRAPQLCQQRPHPQETADMYAVEVAHHLRDAFPAQRIHYIALAYMLYMYIQSGCAFCWCAPDPADSGAKKSVGIHAIRAKTMFHHRNMKNGYVLHLITSLASGILSRTWLSTRSAHQSSVRGPSKNRLSCARDGPTSISHLVFMVRRADPVCSCPVSARRNMQCILNSSR